MTLGSASGYLRERRRIGFRNLVGAVPVGYNSRFADTMCNLVAVEFVATNLGTVRIHVFVGGDRGLAEADFDDALRARAIAVLSHDDDGPITGFLNRDVRKASLQEGHCPIARCASSISGRAGPTHRLRQHSACAQA